jgi:hypothetical protein
MVKLRMFRVGTRMSTVSRTTRQYLVPLKHLLKTRRPSDDACYSVSANLIFQYSIIMSTTAAARSKRESSSPA